MQGRGLRKKKGGTKPFGLQLGKGLVTAKTRCLQEQMQLRRGELMTRTRETVLKEQEAGSQTYRNGPTVMCSRRGDARF